MRAVLSHDAVTMRVPSGLNAAENTATSCLRRTVISLAVAASQIRAVLSADAVTMRDPSGLCGCRVPDDGRSCPLTRGDARTVGAEGSRVHRPIMAAQDRDLRRGGGVPDPGGLVK
jgi:hypothetical protein